MQTNIKIYGLCMVIVGLRFLVLYQHASPYLNPSAVEKKTLIWSCMHPDMPTKNVIHFKFKLLHSSVVKTKQTCIFWWYTDVECLHPLSFDISYQLYTLVASFLANPTIIYEKDVTIYMSSSAWDFSFYSFCGNEKKA